MIIHLFSCKTKCGHVVVVGGGSGTKSRSS